MLEGLSASLSGNLLNRDGTEFDFKEFDDVLTELGALPDKLDTVALERLAGTVTLANFGGFDGAQVLVDTYALAHAAGVECLTSTRETLADLKTALTQARTLVEDTEVLVSTTVTRVITVNNFSLNSASAGAATTPEGDIS